MVEDAPATIKAAHYALTDFLAAADNYDAARGTLMRELHSVLVYTDSLLRSRGLYDLTASRRRSVQGVRLPWGYALSAAPDGSRYTCSWGDNGRSVLTTGVSPQGHFSALPHQYGVIAFQESLRDGLLDDWTRFARAGERVRAKMLDRGHPHGYTETDIFVFD